MPVRGLAGTLFGSRRVKYDRKRKARHAQPAQPACKRIGLHRVCFPFHAAGKGTLLGRRQRAGTRCVLEKSVETHGEAILRQGAIITSGFQPRTRLRKAVSRPVVTNLLRFIGDHAGSLPIHGAEKREFPAGHGSPAPEHKLQLLLREFLRTAARQTETGNNTEQAKQSAQGNPSQQSFSGQSAPKLQKDGRQLFNEIRGKHGRLRKARGTAIPCCAVEPDGRRSGLLWSTALGQQRTNHAGKHIARASLSHACIARQVNPGAAVRRGNNRTRPLEDECHAVFPGERTGGGQPVALDILHGPTCQSGHFARMRS